MGRFRLATGLLFCVLGSGLALWVLFTATVLQPGWYEPVRNRQSYSSKSPKTPQLSRISGRTGTHCNERHRIVAQEKVAGSSPVGRGVEQPRPFLFLPLFTNVVEGAVLGSRVREPKGGSLVFSFPRPEVGTSQQALEASLRKEATADVLHQQEPEPRGGRSP
jgi:hypothetical protein